MLKMARGTASTHSSDSIFFKILEKLAHLQFFKKNKAVDSCHGDVSKYAGEGVASRQPSGGSGGSGGSRTGHLGWGNNFWD